MTWLLLGVLLVCSATVSGSETAVFSLRPDERRRLAERSVVAASILARPTRLLVSLLLANLFVNVAYFTVSASLSLGLAEQGRGLASGAVALGSLTAIIVFGEILPKTLALVAPAALVARLVPFLLALRFALTPLVVVGSAATRILEGLLFRAPSREPIDPRDFKSALAGASALGSYHAVELALLHDVVDFAGRRARQVMVPRVDVTFLDLRQPREQWIATLARRAYTDYPVVDGSVDNLRGTVNAARLLSEPGTPRTGLIEEPLLAPLGMPAERLVMRMQAEQRDLAILLDEFGGVAGVVGYAEITRAVLGELGPLQSGPIEQRSATSWLARGSCPLHELDDVLGLVLPSRRAETLGGALGEALARLPRRGDELLVSGWRLRVVSTRGRRVDQVLLRAEPGAAEVDEAIS